MQLNLRQARRLEREVGTAVQAQAHILSTANHSAEVSIHETFAVAINKSQDRIVNAMNDLENLNNLRFAIRKSIETANETSGINALMNEEAMLKERVKSFGLVGEGMNDDEIEISGRRHAAMVVTGPTANAYGNPNDSIKLDSGLTKQTASYFTNRTKDCNRRLAKIVEDLGYLNTTTKITLTAAQVEMIEQHEIIV